MSASSKSVQQLARRLFRLSLADGAVSPERVTGVLEYVAKHRPAHSVQALRAYRRLIAAELARGQAAIEHAGRITEEIEQSVAAAMSQRYGRPIAAVSRPNPGLIAGLRIRVGDDVYDASIASRLATLLA